MTNGFKIIGISRQTTNKDNQSAQDLAKLWEKFFGEKSQNGENSEVEIYIATRE